MECTCGGANDTCTIYAMYAVVTYSGTLGIDIVKRELDAGRPSIGNVTTNFTFHGQPMRNSHFVFLSAIRGRK